MKKGGGVQSDAGVSPASESAMTELYERSKAAEVGLGREQFAAILNEICAKHAAGGEPRNIAEFYATLRVEELALARACAAGKRSR